MGRSVAFIATALAGAVLYIGCTQDFDQFEPDGTTFTTSSSSSGSGGAGGAGGAGSSMTSVGTFASSSSSASTGGGCTMATDCGDDTNCRFYSCNSGTCSQTNSADNTSIPLSQQVVGDCKEIRCDGAGGEKTVADAQDLPADEPNDCTVEECNADMPAHTPSATGTACSAGVCDGMGNCVECLMDGTGCMPGDTCDNGTCVSCNDGMQNGTETGVDCGGTCKGCNADACTADADCVSNDCVDGVCCNVACTTACRGCNVAGSEGTCSDLPQYQDDTFPMNACTGTMTCNGNGNCRRKNGESCTQNGQCASNNCQGPNGNETCAP